MCVPMRRVDVVDEGMRLSNCPRVRGCGAQVFAIAGPQARKTAAESKEEIRLAKKNALEALEQSYGDDESTSEER